MVIDRDFRFLRRDYEQSVSYFAHPDGGGVVVTDKMRYDDLPSLPVVHLVGRNDFEEDVYGLMVAMSMEGTPISYDFACEINTMFPFCRR